MHGGKSRKSGGISKALVNRIVAESRGLEKAERDKAKGIEKLTPLTIPKPEIPEQWNFHEANKAFDTLIYEWRRLTGDVIGTLWIFYHKLPRIEGRPKNTKENSLVLPSWKEWLKSKGISYKTPTNNFRKLGWLPPTTDEEKNEEKDESAEIVAELKKMFAAELRYLEIDELTVLRDNWSDGGKWWNEVFVKILDVLKKTQKQKLYRQTTINIEKNKKKRRNEPQGNVLVSFGYPDDATPEERKKIMIETMTLTFQNKSESQKFIKWRQAHIK